MDKDQNYVDPIDWESAKPKISSDISSSSTPLHDQQGIQPEASLGFKRKRNRLVEYLFIFPLFFIVLITIVPSFFRNDPETSTGAGFAILTMIFLSPCILAYFAWSYSGRTKAETMNNAGNQKASSSHHGLKIFLLTIAINLVIGLVLSLIIIGTDSNSIGGLIYLVGFLSPIVSVFLAIKFTKK